MMQCLRATANSRRCRRVSPVTNRHDPARRVYRACAIGFVLPDLLRRRERSKASGRYDTRFPSTGREGMSSPYLNPTCVLFAALERYPLRFSLSAESEA